MWLQRKSERCDIASFEDRERDQESTSLGSILKLKKLKEMVSSLELHKGKWLWEHFDFRPISDYFEFASLKSIIKLFYFCKQVTIKWEMYTAFVAPMILQFDSAALGNPWTIEHLNNRQSSQVVSNDEVQIQASETEGWDFCVLLCRTGGEDVILLFTSSAPNRIAAIYLLSNYLQNVCLILLNLESALTRPNEMVNSSWTHFSWKN